MRIINESILNKLCESELNIPEELKVIIDKAEELYWMPSISEYSNGNYLNLSKFSNAGEDFFFEVELGTPEEIIASIKQYAENFDPDEHAKEMDGAPGAPDIRRLLTDADEIKADLENLAEELEKVVKPLNESIGRYTPEDLDEIRHIIDFDGDALGDYRRFTDLSLESLKELVDRGLADPNEHQNDGQSIGAIIELGERLPEAKIFVNGYVIFPPREDQRISVDAVTVDYSNCVGAHVEDIIEDFAENADEKEYENSECYIWWD